MVRAGGGQMSIRRTELLLAIGQVIRPHILNAEPAPVFLTIPCNKGWGGYQIS